MTDPNYWKSLCAQLVDKWGNGKDYWTVIHEMNDALHVEPEPQELTEDEICRLWDKSGSPVPYLSGEVNSCLEHRR